MIELLIDNVLFPPKHSTVYIEMTKLFDYFLMTQNDRIATND